MNVESFDELVDAVADGLAERLRMGAAPALENAIREITQGPKDHLRERFLAAQATFRSRREAP